MEILITNRIYLKISDLDRKLLSKIKEAFRYSNPQYFRLRAMGRYPGNVPKIIATFKLENEGKKISVPRGGMEKLQKILGNINYKVVDKKRKTKKVEFNPDPNFKLRSYQKEAVEKILQNKTCLIECAPAAGKTEIALAAATIGQVTGIIVNTKTLFQQWIERIEKRLGIPKKEIGKIGGGKFFIGKKITVMMQQTVKNKLEDLEGIFGAVFADEVHHYAANTFLNVIDFFDAEYRIGMTAEITRQDLKTFLIHDMFGPVVYKISRDDLVDLGYTSPVTIHVVKTEFEYDYMNEEALRKKFENSLIDFEDLNAKDKLVYQERYEMPRKAYPEYLDASSKNRDRNLLIYKWVMEEYENESKIIIFTKRRKHCEIWKNALAGKNIDCAIFWGTKSKKEEEVIQKDIKRIKAGKIRIAIGTTLDEGVDLPIIDCGFITYRNATNPGQLGQQAGRFARLFGNKKSRLYYFHDERISKFSGDLAALKRTFKDVVIHGKEKKRYKILRKKI